MFGINGSEFLILAVIAVMVLGPTRLPEYAAQLGRLVRELRKLAKGAREQLREEVGPEFDDLDWKKLDPRQYDPRRIIREALLDDDTSAAAPLKPVSLGLPSAAGTSAAGAAAGAAAGTSAAGAAAGTSAAGAAAGTSAAGAAAGTSAAGAAAMAAGTSNRAGFGSESAAHGTGSGGTSSAGEGPAVTAGSGLRLPVGSPAPYDMEAT